MSIVSYRFPFPKDALMSVLQTNRPYGAQVRECMKADQDIWEDSIIKILQGITVTTDLFQLDSVQTNKQQLSR